MDGVPAKGESIPVRMFLSAFPLTPTYRNVHSKFSVRYFLNLILVDSTDRRYFKSEEILLYRRAPKRSRRQKELNEPMSPTDKIPDSPVPQGE
jgi:vacuolar protein sorting-associated protein 26